MYFQASICCDSHEGSVAQCLEVAVHEEEADDEFNVNNMSHWCSCVSRWQTKPRKTPSFILHELKQITSTKLDKYREFDLSVQVKTE